MSDKLIVRSLAMRACPVAVPGCMVVVPTPLNGMEKKNILRAMRPRHPQSCLCEKTTIKIISQFGGKQEKIHQQQKKPVDTRPTLGPFHAVGHELLSPTMAQQFVFFFSRE